MDLTNNHPENIIKKVFPEDVMTSIGNGHHKQKDGGFTIYYDYWNDEWTIEHSGYIRHEISVTNKCYYTAINEFLEKIREENQSVLYHEIENEVNENLTDNIYVQINEHSYSVYKYHKDTGDTLIKVISITPEERNTKHILKEINEQV